MTDSKEDGLTISVEREDLEDGSITYHLWDTTNGDYKWIVGLNDDKLAQGGKSKFYAERIALAVNALSASSPPVGGSGDVVACAKCGGTGGNEHGPCPDCGGGGALQMPPLAAPVPNGVPEGFRLVPIEPTLAMSFAGENEYISKGLGVWSNFHAIYRAMVAAAPASPVTPEGLSGGDADA